MIQQDFILRQVQQLAQALAQVLFHKRLAQKTQAQESLSEGLESALGLTLEELRRLPREGMRALCASGGALSGENTVAVADLLREDSSATGRERALWLYEMALTSGAAVPFDVYERIETLRSSLSD